MGAWEGYVTAGVKKAPGAQVSRLAFPGSNSQEQFSSIKRPEQRENHEGKKDGEGQRSVHRAGVRDEVFVVNPAMQRGFMAMEMEKIKIGTDFGHERRNG